MRGTFVDYNRLDLDGQAVAPANRFFIEPTIFVRAGPGVVQGQGTFGLSMPTTADSDNLLRKRPAPVLGLISVGMVFRPDLLKLREQVGRLAAQQQATEEKGKLKLAGYARR